VANLDGKSAVITGASRGLGRAMAFAFAGHGAAVALGARTAEATDQVAAEIKSSGGDAIAVACDVGDYQQVLHLAERANSEFGAFDIWINNAGISPPYGRTWQVPIDRFKETLETDILGVLYGSWIAVHQFLGADGGVLINLLGSGARGLSPSQNAYGSSKSWVRTFTLTLAKELEDSPVRVIAFNPGLVYTDLVSDVEAVTSSQGRFRVFERVLALWSNPPEVPAQRAVWLATDAAAGAGSEVNQRGRIGMLWDAVRRGLPMLLGLSQREFPVRVRTIAPAHSPLGSPQRSDQTNG
jgi:NAD(P)-dependent dehydrogenase (short-subunit alcohol dehydrogenase family)